ncbi:hypothetical protein HDU96_003842, partial [Phlyctochytrium bullatum]
MDDPDEDEEDEGPSAFGSSFSQPSRSYSKSTLETLNRMDPHRINLELVEALVRYLADHVDNFLPEISDEEGLQDHISGSILVFLPGLAEIRRLYDRLSGDGVRENRRGATQLTVIPLHSMISGAEQALAFKPPPKNHRKIVLATNIAETGITIPDVVCVVDCCRAREISYDERRHITRLAEILVARANCEQRRGRAGRVRPGVCYHLVSKDIFDTM